MADPVVGMLQWNLEAMETLIAGAIGGLFLALGRFLATYAHLQNQGMLLKTKQLFRAQIPPLLILPLLGGGLAWLTIGVSGAFLTGLGALGFILLAAGPHPHAPHAQQAHSGSTEQGDVGTNNQA